MNRLSRCGSPYTTALGVSKATTPPGTHAGKCMVHVENARSSAAKAPNLVQSSHTMGRQLGWGGGSERASHE
eukprot:scaffold3673_cov393-Prasinococcus_capsulatus_cf.AAC.18